MRGKYVRTPEIRAKIASTLKAKGCKPPPHSMFGENNPAWKGDSAGYVPKHAWINRHGGKPKNCSHCGTTKAKKFEWANVSGNYKRDLNDWIRLCTKCHHKMDRIQERGWITKKTCV